MLQLFHFKGHKTTHVLCIWLACATAYCFCIDIVEQLRHIPKVPADSVVPLKVHRPHTYCAYAILCCIHCLYWVYIILYFVACISCIVCILHYAACMGSIVCVNNHDTRADCIECISSCWMKPCTVCSCMNG